MRPSAERPDAAAPPSRPILQATAVSKRFGGVLALDAVDFELRPGEIHALMGENGAGKSTLMKILSGVHTDYEGELTIDGAPVRFASVRDAEARRHRHHPPGAQPGAGAQRRRQHLPRPRAADRRADRRPQGECRGGARPAAAAGHRARPRGAGRRAARRRAAAGRDRQGAVDRGAHPDHGRADLGAVAGRMPAAVRASSASWPPTASPSSTSRTASRR